MMIKVRQNIQRFAPTAAAGAYLASGTGRSWLRARCTSKRSARGADRRKLRCPAA